MNVSDFLGSDFMKAADLGQTTPTIQVAKVEPVTFADGSSKLCIHASDPACKPIVLNVTNSRAMAAMYGPESQNWIGQSVMLSVRQTQMGPGIGVTPLQAPPNQQIDRQPAASLPPAQSVPAHLLQTAPQPQGGQWPGATPQQKIQTDAAGNVGAPFDDDIPFG